MWSQGRYAIGKKFITRFTLQEKENIQPRDIIPFAVLHNGVYASEAETVHCSMILQEALGAKSKPIFNPAPIFLLSYVLYTIFSVQNRKIGE